MENLKNPFGDAKYERKPSGVLLMNGQEVAHTLQCCHCSGHFVSIRGSGKRRGFCTMCKKITCGKPACDVCIPYEEKLEIAEGKSLKNTKFRHELEVIQKEHKTDALFLSINGDKLI